MAELHFGQNDILACPPIYLHWDFRNLEKNTVWTGKNNQFVFKLGKKFQFEISS